MSFYNIDYLEWLFILPFLLCLYIIQVRRRENKVKKWLGIHSDFLRSLISGKKRHIKTTLRLCVLLFMILSLARLQGEGDKVDIQNKGLYILLLVDASNSMLAEDVKPNRLAFMKQELSRLIDLSSGDQIALGVFANSAILASPFTKDFSAVRSYLQDISPDYLTNQGTNFKRAFLLTGKTFKKVRESEKEKTVKALVIVSDGENHTKEDKKAIQKLFLEQDIRVFTLSFGTKEGGVIPIKDYKGRVKAYKKDIQGNLVVTRLKEEGLKNFAKWGKGSYHHVTYGSQAIEQLRQNLDQLEKTFLETTSYVQKKEYYQWFLILAVVAALLELFVNDRTYKSLFQRRRSVK